MFNLKGMTPKKKRTLICWLFFLAASIVILICVSVSGYLYFKQEMRAKVTPTSWILDKGSEYNITEMQNTPNVLSLGLGYSSFDPVKGLKFEMAFNPRNQLATAGSTPTLPICISYGEKDVTFVPLEEMSTTSFALALSGDTSYYPFDVFRAELYINARVGNATSNGTCVEPLALSPAILGSAQGYAITASISPGWDDDSTDPDKRDYSTALISFTARRTKVTICFSLLTFVVMWVLTGIVFTIAFWVWKSGRRTELGLVAISTALMYALPRVRETQAGVPKLGIIIDMVGYLWNVLIVACCVVAQLLNYIIRKNAKRW